MAPFTSARRCAAGRLYRALPSVAVAHPGPQVIGPTKPNTTAIALCTQGPDGVRLLTSGGNDWTDRFPIVPRAVDSLPALLSVDRRGDRLRRHGVRLQDLSAEKSALLYRSTCWSSTARI